jgi:hypothetical protein
VGSSEARDLAEAYALLTEGADPKKAESYIPKRLN